MKIGTILAVLMILGTPLAPMTQIEGGGGEPPAEASTQVSLGEFNI